MEPLIAQLRTLPAKFMALSSGLRIALIAAAVALVGIAALSALFAKNDAYQYAFTKLTPEDATASAEALKNAGIAYRVDAGGEAIAVPADKVGDARLLLASQGLPRAGGVGMEIFDKSELGTSEFTQRVNLQRATEGELARTIQSLAKVRSARVHVTMPKRGLFADEERRPSAAVVVHLQPGRALDEGEIGGIRHLVASAVPELSAEAITIVDGSGNLLDDKGGSSLGAQEKIEKELQQRIVEMLEPAVGRGAVVARVTASMDAAEQDVKSSTFDPDKTALKSEHKRNTQSQTSDGVQGNVTGAAANVALQQPSTAGTVSGKSESKTDNDEERGFEVSGTIAHRVDKAPRLMKLSVAVLVDGPEKEPRSEDDIKRLTELAKHAVGFDEERGDKLQLTSAPFRTNAADAAAAAADAEAQAKSPAWMMPAAIGGAALLALVGGAAAVLFALRRGQKRNGAAGVLTPSAEPHALPPGAVLDASGRVISATATTTTGAPGTVVKLPLPERA
ncbi:MAG TPA: flagellar basal-body MS-ring/collar protein FliF, partial [Myxococcota bacterium]